MSLAKRKKVGAGPSNSTSVTQLPKFQGLLGKLADASDRQFLTDLMKDVEDVVQDYEAAWNMISIASNPLSELINSKESLPGLNRDDVQHLNQSFAQIQANYDQHKQQIEALADLLSMFTDEKGYINTRKTVDTELDVLKVATTMEISELLDNLYGVPRETCQRLKECFDKARQEVDDFKAALTEKIVETFAERLHNTTIPSVVIMEAVLMLRDTANSDPKRQKK